MARRAKRDYERERVLDKQAAARERGRRKRVRAHKRRQAGKIVHVRGYCRRGARSQARIKREMPF